MQRKSLIRIGRCIPIKKQENDIGIIKKLVKQVGKIQINSIINNYLNGDKSRVDKVVYGTKVSDPYYTCLDRYSTYTIDDHIKEMKGLWYPFFYK